MKYLGMSKWNSKRSLVKRKRKREREKEEGREERKKGEKERERGKMSNSVYRKNISFFLLVRTVFSEVLELDAQSNDALECYHRYSHDLVANK